MISKSPGFSVSVALVVFVLFAPPSEALPKIFGLGRDDSEPAPGAAQLAQQEFRAMQRLSEAQSMENSGNTGGARKVYEEIAIKYPFTKTAATAQFRDAQLLETSGKREKAFDAYQNLIEKHPQSAEYVTALERQFQITNDLRADPGGFLTFGKVGTVRLIEMYEKVISNGTRSPFAPKAQFAIGELHADSNELGATTKSIAAFQKVVDTYPDSPEAANAAYKIGNVEFAVSRKSRDSTNLNRAREGFESARTIFPDDPRATEAGANLQQISDAEAGKAYKTAAFYEKKGHLKAAVIYYNEVLKCPGCAQFVDAKERLASLSSNDPKLLDSLAGIQVAQTNLAVPARTNTKGRPDYFGPPAPPERTRQPRMRVDEIPFAPLEEPALPTGPDTPGTTPPAANDLLPLPTTKPGLPPLPPPPTELPAEPAKPSPPAPGN